MANLNHNRNLFESALRQVQQNEKAITNNIAHRHELVEQKENLTEIVGTLITAGLLAAAAAPVAGVAADIYAHRKKRQQEAAEIAREQANKDREHGFNVQRHQENIGETRADRQARQNEAAADRKAREDAATAAHQRTVEREKTAHERTKKGAKKQRRHNLLLQTKKDTAALRAAQIRYGSGGTP